MSVNYINKIDKKDTMNIMLKRGEKKVLYTCFCMSHNLKTQKEGYMSKNLSLSAFSWALNFETRE